MGFNAYKEQQSHWDTLGTRKEKEKGWPEFGADDTVSLAMIQ